MNKIFIIIFSTTVTCLCLSILAGVVTAQDLDIIPQKANRHPKIESRLQALETAAEKNITTARALAYNRSIKMDAHEMVTVYLLLEPENAVDEASLQPYAVEIVKRTHNVLQAKVPVTRLQAIADNVEGVAYIKPPDLLKPVVESEGVNLTNAASFHAQGYTGSGVKVAVIDVGFAGLSAAISTAEVPNDVVTVDCTGASCSSASVDSFSADADEHGTAVAEIIHDMAPGAQLYLIKIWNTLDLIDAKDYAVSRDIDIINHSLIVTNTNFYDGKCWYGNPVCTADDAYSNGILWVNAVGNEATRHYEATFTDTDSDGWHNVSAASEAVQISANVGDTIQLSLTWDAWPLTSQDYDLYLFDQNSNIVASSQNSQTGTQFPVEDLSYSVMISGTYSIGIRRHSATSNHRLELYSDFHDLSPAVAVSSLLSPADAEGALTVGAVGYRNWTTGPIQYFSSQGPTNDNRIKPDISGPDGVSNYIYGNFFGTSASCAHVSGAAALILAKNSGYSAAQLRSVLTSTAIDMGSAGRDNLYGYGRLNLDINATADSSSDGNDDDGGGGGCFIATAAYDAPVTPHFHTLQLLIFGCTLIGITILAKNTIKIGRKNTQTNHFRRKKDSESPASKNLSNQGIK